MKFSSPFLSSLKSRWQDKLFLCALTKGPASQVTPASSAYPIVTVVGSALFLSEKLTLIRGVGTALVVAAVVLLSR